MTWRDNVSPVDEAGADQSWKQSASLVDDAVPEDTSLLDDVGRITSNVLANSSPMGFVSEKLQDAFAKRLETGDPRSDAAQDEGFLDRAGSLLERGTASALGGLNRVKGTLNPFGEQTLRRARTFEEGAKTEIEGTTDWEQVKQDPSAGNIGSFILEQGIQSAPEMALLAIPYVGIGAEAAIQSGRIGQDRAENNNREDATLKDVGIGAAFGVPAAYLERVGVKGILGGAGKNAATRIGGAAAKEGATEFAQSILESTGGTLGTDTGFDLATTLDEGLAGTVAGVGIGGGLRSGVEIVDGTGRLIGNRTRRPVAKGAKEQSIEEAQLSQADLDSPIPDDLIGEGKARIADALGGTSADGILKANGLPKSGSLVEVDLGDGRKSTGTIEDAFAEADASGVVIRLSDGNIMRENFDDLADAGVSIAPASYEQKLEAAADAEDAGLTDQIIAAQQSGRVEPVDQNADSQPSAASTGFIMPTQGRITSRFGNRKAPKKGASTNHGGVDIALAVGTPLKAPARGKVIASGHNNKSGYFVRIDHGNGIVSGYAHLNKKGPKVGSVVEQGQEFAQSGNSGNSTGPHLHYTMTVNGTKVDPLEFAGEAGTVEGAPVDQGIATEYSDVDRTGFQAADAQPIERGQPIEVKSQEQKSYMAVTTSGREVPVKYAVAEISDLLTSNSPDGRVNPAYPQALQPRDRARGTSLAQISNIAANLNPRLLGRTAKASDGAPIIGPDGVVESGNGRILALNEAYARGGDKAEAYRQFLKQEGFDTEGVNQPVLVRVRDGEMNDADLQSFVQEANQRDVMDLSAPEQAAIDAKALSPAVLSRLTDADLDTAGNRDFVRAFFGQVASVNDLGGLIAKDGTMSQDAVKRVQGALLTKAYGDKVLVEKSLVSTNNNTQSIVNALTNVAGPWAQMVEAAKESRIDPAMDITANLTEAVRIIETARTEGKNVSDMVNQSDVFSGKALSPMTAGVLRLFFNRPDYTKPNGQRQVAGALRFYVTEAMKTSAEADLLGAETKAEAGAIVDLAKERQTNEPVEESTAEAIAADEAEGQGVGREDAGRSESGEPEGSNETGQDFSSEPAGQDAPALSEPDGGPDREGVSPDAGQEVEQLSGEKIDSEWVAFDGDSGSLGIPRAEMPQIKAENRGAMVNFLNARDIAHQEETVPAGDLKPTQREFSTKKVQKAKEFEGGDRAILVSKDSHVVDGHHQWLASLDKGEDIRIIRLDAPIRELLPVVSEMPSAETDGGNKPQPVQENGTKARIEDNPSGKSVTIIGASADQLTQIREAIPKAKPLNKKLPGGARGVVYSKKYKDKIQGVLEPVDKTAEKSPPVAEQGAQPQKPQKSVNLTKANFRKTWKDLQFRAAMKAIGEMPHIESSVAQDMVRGWLDGKAKNLDAFDAAMQGKEDQIIEIASRPGERGAGQNPREGYAEAFYAAVTDNPREIRTVAHRDTMGLAGAFNAVQKIIEPETVAQRNAEPARVAAPALTGSREEKRVKAEAMGKEAGLTGKSRTLPESIKGDNDLENHWYAGHQSGIAEKDGNTKAFDSDDEPMPSRLDDEPVSDYGADNKLVTQDRAAELRDKLKEKLNPNRVNSGIDPEVIAIGTELAVFHIEAGARKFTDFSKAVASDLGMNVKDLRRYLRGWYNGARETLVNDANTATGIASVLQNALAKFDTELADAELTIEQSNDTIKEFTPKLDKTFEGGDRIAELQGKIDTLEAELQGEGQKVENKEALLSELEDGAEVIIDNQAIDQDGNFREVKSGSSIDDQRADSISRPIRESAEPQETSIKRGNDREIDAEVDTDLLGDPLDDQASLFSLADGKVRKQFATDLQARIKQLGLSDKVLVRSLKKLSFDIAEGQYSPAQRIISILDGARSGESYVLNHEVIHAMRDLGLFRSAEWTALTKRVKANDDLMISIKNRYGKLGLSDEQLTEEAVADLFADWSANRQEIGFVRAALTRIADFMEAIGNFVSGYGLQSAGSVMRDIEAGKVGARDARPRNLAFQYPDDLDGVMFSIPERAPMLAEAGRSDMIKGKAADLFDRWRTAIQDRYLPLLRTVQSIEQQLGRPLSADENPYIGEELMTGRTGARVEKLTDNMVEPLFDAMHTEGVDIDQLESYLYARHAPERNARIASINPDFEEGTGSGMTDIEARAIMARIKREGKTESMERLAKRVDAIRDMALEVRVEAGLMSREEADAWRDTYTDYVPLRGAREGGDAGGIRINRSGGGINVRGKESRAAFGRRSKADSILAYTILQAEEAIVRAETNGVAQQFIQLAEKAPDDAFWELEKVVRKPVMDKNTGLVRYEAQTRIQPEDKDFTVTAKFGGEERRVTLNRDNVAARRLADSMRNLTQQQLDWVTKHLGVYNRYLSSINTQWNPEFIISNAFRDFQTAAINLAGFDQKNMVRNTVRDYRKAMAASLQGSFKKGGGEWGRWYDEFISEGGRVYFNHIESLEGIKKRMLSSFNMAAAKQGKGGAILQTKRGFFAVKEFVEASNLGVENAIRLAAYKNAREGGMSKKEAASLAKNLTVNFNRRGTMGPAINAAYLFFNASMQGSVRILQSMKKKRVRKILAGIAVSGFVIEMMNAMLSAEDDDGELIYDKISDYDKSRNMIIMIPGTRSSYLKFPMAYGYSAFYVAGHSMAEVARRGGEGAMSTWSNFVGAVADSFNPVGGTNNLLNFFSPTIIDPIVDLERNRDYKDSPIMPDQNQYGPETPDSQRYWGSVEPHWRAVTDTLTKLTGGNDVEPGAVDVSPETLEHLFGTVTGAAGAFVDRNVGLAGKMIDDKQQVTANDLPMVRKLYGEKPSWYDKSAFYDRLSTIEQNIAFAKKYAEREDWNRFDTFATKNKELLSLEPEMKAARKEMRAIRKAKRANDFALEMEKIDTETYGAEADILKTAEDSVIKSFNTRWNDVMLPGQ